MESVVQQKEPSDVFPVRSPANFWPSVASIVAEEVSVQFMLGCRVEKWGDEFEARS